MSLLTEQKSGWYHGYLFVPARKSQWAIFYFRNYLWRINDERENHCFAKGNCRKAQLGF